MYILSGYSHYPTQGPYLQLDDIASQPATRRWIPVSQQSIHIKLLTKRYCTGRYDLATGTSICCPGQKEVVGKQTQCKACSQTIVFNPAFYHVSRAQLSPQQQLYNLQPHDVYLAYFGKKIIKVGIAHTKRLCIRWLEQGARAAVVLEKMPDAYTARSLEERIHHTYNIPERITSLQKERYLALSYHFAEANTELAACQEEMGQGLEMTFTPHSVENLQHYYFPKGQPTTLYQTPKTSKQIMGYGVGLVGDILIYNQNGYCLTLPLKPLLGQVQVILGIEGLPQHSTPEGLQTQLALFS
jgi:hypothetical protein